MVHFFFLNKGERLCLLQSEIKVVNKRVSSFIKNHKMGNRAAAAIGSALLDGQETRICCSMASDQLGYQLREMNLMGG